MTTQTYARRGLWLLPVWASLLFLATLTHQPDPLTAFADFSAYITTDIFLVSHLGASIAGAAVGSIGVVMLLIFLQASKGSGKAVIGMAATVASNVFLTAIFGVAAFAQPAMGRLFLAGEENAIEFYNEVYAAPLFGTAMLGLLLLLIGGVFLGVAIARSGLLPKWTGWTYAASIVGFVLSFILFPLGMSVFAALLFGSTVVIAWNATRKVQSQISRATVSLGYD